MNGDGERRKRGPSFTSLVAFFLIVSPIIYVLSYAPIVRVCGRPIVPAAIPDGTSGVIVWFVGEPMADSSLYPAYKPVDWLIDNTPVRRPLFVWAEVWGVRDAFEIGYLLRNDELNAHLDPAVFSLH